MNLTLTLFENIKISLHIIKTDAVHYNSFNTIIIIKVFILKILVNKTTYTITTTTTTTTTTTSTTTIKKQN